MPLFFRKRKPSEEARKRLEYQMCLVREMGFLRVHAHLQLRPRQQGSPLQTGHTWCDLFTVFPAGL